MNHRVDLQVFWQRQFICEWRDLPFDRVLLGLCRAESGVPGFRSGVRRTRVRASAKLLTNALRHRRCPLFAEDRADGDPESRPEGSRPEYGVRRSEVGDRTERE